jgi:hypothetical protein
MATTSRFSGLAGDDNTSRVLTNAYLTPIYAASIAIVPTQAHTVVKPGALTGALSLTIGVGTSSTNPYVGDTIRFLFAASGADRIVTFSTGFKSAGTLTVVSAKWGSASFMFDGVNWVETGRALTA